MNFNLGSTLLEVMISLTVVSSTLLGLLADQTVVLKSINSAYLASVAAEQLANVAEVTQIKTNQATAMREDSENRLLLPNNYGKVDQDSDSYNIKIF